MRKTIALGLAAMMLLMTPAGTFAARASVRTQPGAGAITGIARDATGVGVAGARVRVRNANFGEIASQVLADGSGGFSISGLKPGKYLVEALGAYGQVIGISPLVSVAAGTTAAVVLSASAPSLRAVQQSTPSGSDNNKVLIWSLVGAGAAAAAIIGFVAANDDDSPSN